MNKQNGYLRMSGSGENTVSYEGVCEITSDERQLTIEFDESCNGIEATRTFLVISEGLMTLNRVGDFATVMVFETGRENPVNLGSPYGNIELRLLTDKLSIDRGDDGVDVTVSYRFVLGQESMPNVLRLEARTNLCW